MRLNDAYRVLDSDPSASDQEIKRMHRDLMKVWHPDRFGSDAALRQKAEEKLKAINEAYETIRASREGRSRRFAEEEASYGEDEGGAWRVRWAGREIRVASVATVASLIDRGAVGEGAEVFDPSTGKWAPAADYPELRAALTRKRVHRSRTWAITCAAIAIFVLLRRPTPAGLVIALVLFVIAGVFIMRMRT